MQCYSVICVACWNAQVAVVFLSAHHRELCMKDYYPFCMIAYVYTSHWQSFMLPGSYVDSFALGMTDG